MAPWQAAGRVGSWKGGAHGRRRARQSTPQAEIWGSIITFVPRYLHARNGVCVFRPTTRSRPRLGLVVRCGDLALSQKTCLFVRFFTYSQNTKMTPFPLIPKVFGHV